MSKSADSYTRECIKDLADELNWLCTRVSQEIERDANYKGLEARFDTLIGAVQPRLPSLRALVDTCAEQLPAAKAHWDHIWDADFLAPPSKKGWFTGYEELLREAHDARRRVLAVGTDCGVFEGQPVGDAGEAGSGETEGPQPGNFAANLERLRKEAGWSKDKLATETGLDRKEVVHHTTGKTKNPYPKTRLKYAKALSKGLGREVTVEDLDG